MGIDVHGLRLLEHAFRVDGPLGSTLTVGRQCLSAKKRELRKHFGMNRLSTCRSAPYVDDLLVECFGATAVASIDISDYEGCTYVRDLNAPLEDDFPKFDTIIDAGCLEHVLDVLTAFKNISRSCRIGGRILHITPANNFVGHGFYQFSPEFFFSFYSEACGFAGTEVYLVDRARPGNWWKVGPPSGLSRSIAMSSNETYALVRTRKVSEAVADPAVQQPHYVTRWESAEDEGGNRHPIPGSLVRLKALTDSVPTNARARLVQMRARTFSGMHSRNPALTRVSPPSRRTRIPAR